MHAEVWHVVRVPWQSVLALSVLVDLVSALDGSASGDLVNAEGPSAEDGAQAQGAVPQPRPSCRALLTAENLAKNPTLVHRKRALTRQQLQQPCVPAGGSPSCSVALSFRPQVKSHKKADRRHEFSILASATKALGCCTGRGAGLWVWRGFGSGRASGDPD